MNYLSYRWTNYPMLTVVHTEEALANVALLWRLVTGGTTLSSSIEFVLEEERGEHVSELRRETLSGIGKRFFWVDGP